MSWTAGIIIFSLIGCVHAASRDVSPYQFNGIVLDSSESDLPQSYKALFRESDCRPERLGQTPVKGCARAFPPRTLPGLPPDVKGPVHFHVHYVGGRLQRFGFGFARDDYAAFVAMLTREHGAPSWTASVTMDSVKETEYTWHRGRYSIATYAFSRTTKESSVFYSVIREDPSTYERLLGPKR